MLNLTVVTMCTSYCAVLAVFAMKNVLWSVISKKDRDDRETVEILVKQSQKPTQAIILPQQAHLCKTMQVKQNQDYP